MAKALVVVESPAKAKTINKYLGRDFKVIASMGHVRDLPKSKLGEGIGAPRRAAPAAKRAVVCGLAPHRFASGRCRQLTAIAPFT